MAIPIHPNNMTDPTSRLLARINELEQRLATLERRTRIPLTGAAPTGGADGDSVSTGAAVGSPRLWIRIEGTWRATTLA